jgi:cell division protein FtsI (penicillin-binding protein 3)
MVRPSAFDRRAHRGPRLDESIQHVAERELERAVTESQAQAGGRGRRGPLDGEVLAMANWPTFNPNRFGAYPSAPLAQPRRE